MQMEIFEQLNVVAQALLATMFTWGVTALGAASVFFFKKITAKANWITLAVILYRLMTFQP